MGIKITGVALDDVEVRRGNLVLVGNSVVLVTGDNYRGVVLDTKLGAHDEKPFRVADAKKFSGTVTISNK
jgi:hypothetical protein